MLVGGIVLARSGFSGTILQVYFTEVQLTATAMTQVSSIQPMRDTYGIYSTQMVLQDPLEYSVDADVVIV